MCTAAREACASQYQGSPIEGIPDTPQTSRHYMVLRGLRGCLNRVSIVPRGVSLLDNRRRKFHSITEGANYIYIHTYIYVYIYICMYMYNVYKIYVCVSHIYTYDLTVYIHSYINLYLYIFIDPPVMVVILHLYI